MTQEINILFVCLGNICRSPSAEGVFRKLVQQSGLRERINIDSCGTAGWHINKSPDPRAQKAAKARGIDITKLKARQVSAVDFEKFHLIVAMDEDNLSDLSDQCPDQHAHKLSLMLDHGPNTDIRSVPDPYYGPDTGFDDMLDLIEQASIGLLKKIEDAA